MAALTCDICGGKLVGKAGGIFECDSCGMEYDTSWAKQKIQEIKGTVRIEGTVQVELKGGASAENFVKRGNMALADQKWSEAEGFFNQALDIDAECAEAYLGKFCACSIRCEPEALMHMGGEQLLLVKNSSTNYARAKQFASPALKEWLEQFEKQLEEKAAADREARLEAERKAEEERLEAERKAEEERLEAERKAEEERLKAVAALQFERMEVLLEEKNALLEELPTLGRLSRYRRTEIEARLAEIEAKLAEIEAKLAEIGARLAEIEKERKGLQ